MKTIRISLDPISVLVGALSLGGCLTILSMQQVSSTTGILSADQREFLQSLSMVDLDDGQGGVARTVRISGINVQIVNGLGATNGHPANSNSVDELETVVNGVGNLIVGYNELRSNGNDNRTGSHNVVTGHRQNFTSYGGVVVGRSNNLEGAYASIAAGASNTASGLSSAVTGGRDNVASGTYATISGGSDHLASGLASSVSGGSTNTASGTRASISGGLGNLADFDYSSVSGGELGQSSGHASSVSGGLENVASGAHASISGGDSTLASGVASSVSGGRFGEASGDWSTISGGGPSVSSRATRRPATTPASTGASRTPPPAVSAR